MYREHTLPLLKAMDDEGRLRIVNIRLCSIIDCIFGKLLFFLKVDGDASDDRVCSELQRCLTREIEVMKGPATSTTAEAPEEEAVNESENSLFFWQGGIIAHSHCTWSFSKTSNGKWQLLHFFSLLHTIEATTSLYSIEWLLSLDRTYDFTCDLFHLDEMKSLTNTIYVLYRLTSFFIELQVFFTMPWTKTSQTKAKR